MTSAFSLASSRRATCSLMTAFFSSVDVMKYPTAKPTKRAAIGITMFNTLSNNILKTLFYSKNEEETKGNCLLEGICVFPEGNEACFYRARVDRLMC